uniref:Uncharacterized protein n=1 Tax=Aegilops tauschii subsp. strangulata TaxID=200361 RepID=A0A452Y9X1_AEGTS|nr:uncharacterized protein LOC109781350 isoform X2 [Aegilops tauschii subsp. strangulata]
MLPASESKFTSMCCSTRTSQPTLEQVCVMREISSTCALVTFVGMSEQKEKLYIFVQHFDPASREFLIFFCATVRPRHFWQSHKDESGLRSSTWFPSEFLRLKVGFHVEVWNAMYMEILMEYDDGDVAQLFLVDLQQQETRDHLRHRWSHEGHQKWYIIHKKGTAWY